MMHMIGEWLIDKVPGPMVPVAAVLYGMALDVRDALRDRYHR